MTRLTIPALLCTVLLSACSSKPADTAAATPKAPPAPTVIDPQLKALEDAKAVQATLDEAEGKRRQALEDAGG